ncbi:MAG TPA: DUF177 domain-containing protein [Candidatus Binatia bacterium]
MKLLVSQIAEAPKELSFAQSTEELNRLYSGPATDFRFPEPLDVSLVYYRSGADLFFHGRIAGAVEGSCSRCLKSYSFPLDKEFDFVLTPDPRTAKNRELAADELGLSFYREDEIDLAPFIREQVLLALPTRPLCEEACRGLCPSCGVDLNESSCRCSSSRSDPRLAVFRDMKLQQ